MPAQRPDAVSGFVDSKRGTYSRFLALCALCTFAMCVGVFLPAWLLVSANEQAFEGDGIGGAIRVDNLERRLMAIEQKVYPAQRGVDGPSHGGSFTDRYSNPARFSGPEGASGPAPVGGGVGSGLSADGSRMMADLEIRMQQLEEESRTLYGGVEELSHAVSRLADRVELITKDMELRLQDLERSVSSGVVQNSLPMHSKLASALSATPSETKTSGAQEVSADVPPSSGLATMAGLVEAVPAQIKADDMYQKAYTFLTATQYPTAEAWLEEFLKRFPQHKLADNAHYWLGEVYLVQNRPDDAVIQFSEGLASFPQGQKAAGNLLKMGVALERMGQPDKAKTAWQRVMDSYPGTPESQKARQMLAGN